MKKLQILVPVLAVVLAISSAFKAPVKLETEYYTANGSHFEEKGAGTCISGDYYCTYIANVANPNLDNPSDFTPQGSFGEVFLPSNP